MARDLDERVALKVLGWSYQTFPDGQCPDVKHWYSKSPCPNDAKDDSFMGPVQPFTSSVTFDFRVMKHVQEHWDAETKSEWTRALAGALSSRAGKCLCYDLCFIRWYEPGDYSMAALAAVGE